MKTNDGNLIVQLVQDILDKAVSLVASDIHLEPTEENLRVRFRVDGMLYDQESIANSIMHQVLSRLKVLANVDIAEKRIPQDGTFSITVDENPIDLRVSTFPSQFGEKIVVRILDRAVHTMSLENIGMPTDMLATFKSLINQASGFFLVVGPTGSGKTTTLYAALDYLNSPEKNIITLEDPVEYRVENITQGQIKPEAGFTFEKGIRALLRQDPDVLMVGEIRDKQTAHIAIEAALTGHVVLSTLHTNDATSTIMRLMDMGIQPFLMNASLCGILAQRLARKICQNCKQEVEPNEQEQVILKQLDLDLKKIFRGAGCNACLGSGYKGRIGIFEILVMTNELRALIVQNPSFDAITQQALTDGMHILLIDGLKKVKDSTISVQELARVLL